MTALEELAAAIDAGGERTDWMPWIDPMDRTRGILPYKFCNITGAYNGSLDAAKALHEAVLPGWVYLIGSQVSGVSSPDHEDPVWYNKIHAANPARAWLLAIVRALIAKEAAQ